MNSKQFLNKQLFFLFFILLFLSLGATAAEITEEPSIEIQKGTESDTFLGEKVSFYIKLLSPSVFAGSPRFDLPTVSTGLLYQVQARPVLGTENKNGHSYTSQLYEIWFFPKQSGKITVPAINVNFSTSETDTKKEKEYTKRTQPFSLDVKPIPGVPEGEQLIVTDDFEVTQIWKPEVHIGIVGDAITRTISMRAKNMASIFLPEIETPAMKDVSIYRDAPVVNDRNERGEATADRTELITYVFESAGEHTIPDITITWWDSASKKIREHLLKGLTVTMSVNPHSEEGEASVEGREKRAVNLRLLVLLVGIFFFVGVFTYKKYGKMKEYFRSHSEKRAQSEKAYFLRLKKACDSDDQVAAYNTLYLWFTKKFGNSDLISFVYREGADPAFQEEFEKLNTQLFTENKGATRTNWKGKRLYRLVKRIRKNSVSIQNNTMRDIDYRQLNF